MDNVSPGDARDNNSIKDLCRRLSESGLMDGAAIRTVWNSISDTHQPRNAEELAHELMRRKRITAYQYEQLKSGDVDALRFDQYVITDRIGAGGMGDVYKARHERMQRDVAIKLIAKKLLDSPDALQRFDREVRAAAQLSHPNIVAAYDAGEKDGTHYLVMEFVDGQDLSTIIGRHGPLRVALALDYIVQAAEGLQYAHRKAIVHRDIKPANLLVDSTGVVKILDMGLAFVDQQDEDITETSDPRLTQQGQVMGTCAYMAPEQAVDVRQAEARSDIYSLGCTLYELLVGRPPYAGETYMAVIVAHREEPIPSICAQRPEVPPAVDQVVQKMIAKKPHDRYASMGEVIAALRACTMSEPGVAAAGGGGAKPLERAAPPPARGSEQSQASVAIAQAPPAAKENDTFGVIAAKHDTVVSRRRTKSGSRLNTTQLALLAAAGLLLMLGLGGGALAVLLSLRTPQGTLLVESDDPDVKVAVMQGGDVVEIVDAKDNWKVGLKEGKYQLELTGGQDKFQLDQNVVIVSRGNTERLRVTFKPDPAAAKNSALPKPGGTDGGQSPDASAVASNSKPPVKVKRRPPPELEPSSSPIVEATPKMRLLHELSGRRSDASDMAFSPDGKTLASCSRDGHVVMWDVATGKLAGQFQVRIRSSDLAYSPDGNTIAVVGHNLGAAIHNAKTGALVHTLSNLPEDEVQEIIKKTNRMPLVSCVAYSPDGKELVTGNGYGEVQIWDTATGKETAKVKVHISSVYAVRYSPDGKYIASASYDGTSQTYDAATHEPLQTLRHDRESTVFDVAFSRDSQTLFTCGNATNVVSWDVKTGKELAAMRGHGAPIICMSMSSDEKMIATTGSGDSSLRFWDVASGKALSVLRGSSEYPGYVLFSPVDPAVFATSGSDIKVRLWKYEGQEVDDRGNIRVAQDNTVILHQEVGDDHVLIPPWQSFKAPLDGTILQLDVRPNAAHGAACTISIFEGEGVGGKKIHTQQVKMPNVGSLNWAPFPLTEAVPVEKGKTYTWEFAGASGLKHSNGDRYADGKAGYGCDHCFRLYFEAAAK